MLNINKINTEEPATKKAKTEKAVPSVQKEEIERVKGALRECLDSHDNNRKEVQEQLHNMREKWRKEIDDLEDKINSELEAKFKEEDSHLQAALSNLHIAISAEETRITEAFQRAKAELLVMQMYNLNEREVPVKLSDRLELKTEMKVIPEWFDKPRGLKVNKASDMGRVLLSFTRNNTEQERVLAKSRLGKITYKTLFQKKGEKVSGKEYSLRKEEKGYFYFVPNFLDVETAYPVKVKAELKGKQSEWSEEAKFITPEFSECCVWKECPGCVGVNDKYSVDEKKSKGCNKNKW